MISANSRRDKAQAIPRLLSLVAIRSGSTLVLTDIARSADLSRNTARDYLTYLDIVFLTAEVSPWSTNLISRLSKTPKVYLTDSGLAAHLLGVSAADLRRTGHPALGGSVVGIEVKSSASPGTDAARHLRWRKGQLGEKFTAGIILHLGTRSTSFGGGIYALPLSALWGHAVLEP